MKRLAAIAVILVAACENSSSKLGDKAGEDDAKIAAALANIEERLAALEIAHKVAPGTGAQGDAALLERVQKIETGLMRREEALGFLEMAYLQQKHEQEEKAAGEADPDAVFAVDISGPLKAGQVEGPNSATVTIIKAFDFACPYCQQLNEPLHELVRENAGKVRVVYMNLVVHDVAQVAHLYSCAAAKQQKYLVWKDAFWEKAFAPYSASGGRDQSSMAEDNILKLSADAGLDVGTLKTDAHGNECQQRVGADVAELKKFKVNGTPGLFINGKFIGGAIPKAKFQEIIDEKLAIAEKSGVGGAEYYDKEIMGKGVHQFRSKKDAGKP